MRPLTLLPHISVEPVVVSMQYLIDTSPIFWGDASLDLVVSHLVQPNLVVSMQSLIDNTPIFWGDAFLELVFLCPIQPIIE
jgi:hypothetical protein